jgi:hypothetical protein
MRLRVLRSSVGPLRDLRQCMQWLREVRVRYSGSLGALMRQVLRQFRCPYAEVHVDTLGSSGILTQ